MKLLAAIALCLFSLNATAESYDYVFYDGSTYSLDIIQSGKNAWLQVPGLTSVILLSDVDQPKIQGLDVMTSEALDPARHGNSVKGLSQINIVIDHGSNHPIFFEGVEFVRNIIEGMNMDGASSVPAHQACPKNTAGVMVMHFENDSEAPYIVCLTKAQK